MQRSIACLVICCAVSISPSWAQGIRLITGSFPPLTNQESGVLTGPAIDIVDRIQDKLRVHYQIEAFTWARAYAIASNTPNALLFSTARTPARESLFKWIGPFAVRENILYGRKGESLPVSSVKDVVECTIGVKRGSDKDVFLTDSGCRRIERVTDEIQNLKKLVLGRIDLWYTDAPQAKAASSQLGEEGEVIEICTLNKSYMYLAFNRLTPDSIVARWQGAFSELVREGEVERILARYNLEYLYPRP